MWLTIIRYAPARPAAGLARFYCCCQTYQRHLVGRRRSCLTRSLQARQVAEVLTEKDVVRAHARDELGIGEVDQTRLGGA